MRDYIELGSAPYDEDCVQVSMGNYFPKMLAECNRFKDLLIKLFPIPKNLPVSFGIKNFQHDFGPYCEVIIQYEDLNPRAVDFAYNVESNIPANWN